MLQITIPDRPPKDTEYFNNATGEFETIRTKGLKGATVKLEHSLIAVSKWEAKFKKSFLNTKQMTFPETVYYVRCMTLGTPPPNPEIYNNLSKENLDAIYAYINDPMTATWFKEDKVKRPSRKIITAERVYSWMIDCEIPIEVFEKRHMNHLLTLIRVRREEMSKDNGKKMKRKDMLAQNRSLNASRRARMGSKG